jgi:hypothetical protein
VLQPSPLHAPERQSISAPRRWLLSDGHPPAADRRPLETLGTSIHCCVRSLYAPQVRFVQQKMPDLRRRLDAVALACSKEVQQRRDNWGLRETRTQGEADGGRRLSKTEAWDHTDQ